MRLVIIELLFLKISLISVGRRVNIKGSVVFYDILFWCINGFGLRILLWRLCLVLFKLYIEKVEFWCWLWLFLKVLGVVLLDIGDWGLEWIDFDFLCMVFRVVDMFWEFGLGYEFNEVVSLRWWFMIGIWKKCFFWCDGRDV